MTGSNRRRSKGLFGAGLCLFLLAPVLPSAASAADDVLAVVGERQITAAEFRAELVRRGAASPGGTWSEQDQRAVFADLLQTEAAATLARRSGYEQRPEIRRAIAQLLASRYEDDQLQPQLAALTVSDEEVSRYYAEHPEEFRLPRRVRGAVVWIAVPRKAAEPERAARRARAERALEQSRQLPSSGVGFGQVAAASSDDQATRYRGGDTGLVTLAEAEARWGAQVAAALFALGAPGELAPIVETPLGFFLVKLLEDVPAAVRPLAEADEQLRRGLLAGKRAALRAAFAAATAQKAAVRVDAAVLESTIAQIRAQSGAERETSPPGSPAGPRE